MRDVQQVFNQIIESTNASLTFDRLRGNIECFRNKPLLIEVDTMPISMNGYVVSLLDVDLICINPDLDEVLAQITTLHEISHLILDHGENSPLTYADFIRNRDLKFALPRASAFDDPHEEVAELLGTHLFEAITAAETEMPSFARIVYRGK